jgi:hypothetical protein
VDVSTPGELTLLGQTELAGEPFEMYRREGLLFAMANGALGPEGEKQPVAAPGGPNQVAMMLAVALLRLRRLPR